MLRPIAHRLTGAREPPTAATALFNIRLPRVLTAALVGAVLAGAGAAYQTIFRNPLVSPDILGVSAGAGFGAVLAILWSLPVLSVQLMGFLFGLATVAAVVGIAAMLRGQAEVLVMVLTGIALAALASAGISVVKILADPDQQLSAIIFSLLGSLAGVTIRDVISAVPPIVLGLAPLLALAWPIGVVAMGEDEARSLGVNTDRLRLLVILCATLVTAAAVAISGTIGWIGLMVPHMARFLLGALRSATAGEFALGRDLSGPRRHGRALRGDDGGATRRADSAPRCTRVRPAPGAGTARVGVTARIEPPLVEARALTIGYRGRPAVRDIALSVSRGEVSALLGPNGAGKTTLFRTLLGSIASVAGQIRLCGRDLSTLSRTEIAHLAARPGTELSGGERQMVLIMRALAQKTPPLMLDEPAASLDRGNRHRLMERLESLAAQGLGLIISIHEPDHARRLPGRVLTIDGHGNTWIGPPLRALEAERLAQLYDLPVAAARRAWTTHL